MLSTINSANFLLEKPIKDFGGFISLLIFIDSLYTAGSNLIL
jgi:hypothetical protein